VSERPPRVLHVGKYLPPVPGGIETYLGDLLRVSMRHGMPVGAIVHEKQGYPKPNPDDFGGAKIYSVPTFGQLLYAPVAPSFPWRLRQAIRDFKPDILHLHMPNTSVFAALLLPEARAIPWVVHWHADVDVGRMSIWMRLAYKLYKPFETALLRHTKSIIATSEEYLAASQPLQDWQEKCRVVKLAVDFERLTIPTEDEVRTAAALWHQPSQTRFLAVGRLANYKGFDFLIGALRDIPTGTLVIVGDGPSRCLLEGLKEKLDLQDRVRLIGEVPSAELAAIFAAADVLCMVSFDRSEAFGLVILEAARFGTAIVAAEICGTPSAGIATRFGGARFPAGDRKALSTVMSGLASGKVQRVPIPSGLDLDLQPLNRIYTNCRR
jgi:glycosyltransferase involved in cell wall biosynthesis